jgi:AraC-like DNA-binding protein
MQYVQAGSDSIRVEGSFYHLCSDETDSPNWNQSFDQSQYHVSRQIERSINHMRRHLDKPLTISTLSSVAGFSSSHFFVSFKSVTGCAPMEFFVRLRMQHACKMLTNHSVRVKEIAAALGYDDPFHFSRLFKSVIGTSPRDYRRNMLSPKPAQKLRLCGHSPPDNMVHESAITNSFVLIAEAS